jgi:hypothetical protein
LKCFVLYDDSSKNCKLNFKFNDLFLLIITLVGIDSVHIKFAQHNLIVFHHHQVCNYEHVNKIVSDNLKIHYYPPAYKISRFQWLIIYLLQTKNETLFSFDCPIAVLRYPKTLSRQKFHIIVNPSTTLEP